MSDAARQFGEIYDQALRLLYLCFSSRLFSADIEYQFNIDNYSVHPWAQRKRGPQSKYAKTALRIDLKSSKKFVWYIEHARNSFVKLTWIATSSNWTTMSTSTGVYRDIAYIIRDKVMKARVPQGFVKFKTNLKLWEIVWSSQLIPILSCFKTLR